MKNNIDENKYEIIKESITVDFDGDENLFVNKVAEAMISLFEANKQAIVYYNNISVGFMANLNDEKYGSIVSRDIFVDIGQHRACSGYWKTLVDLVIGVPVQRMKNIDNELGGLKIDVHIYIE